MNSFRKKAGLNFLMAATVLPMLSACGESGTAKTTADSIDTLSDVVEEKQLPADTLTEAQRESILAEFNSIGFDERTYFYNQRILPDEVDEDFMPLLERTKERLNNAKVIMWDLSYLYEGKGTTGFYRGGAVDASIRFPDCFRNYFKEAGFDDEHDFEGLCGAMEAGDRKARLAVERLVKHSFDAASELSGVTVSAYSPLRSSVILHCDINDEIYAMGFGSFRRNIPFADILLEGYLRLVSDGNLTYRSFYKDSPELQYIEHLYDNTYKKHFEK